MKKVKYNDTFVYVDDTPLDENETGKLINDNDDVNKLEKTMEISVDLIDEGMENE